MISDAEIEYLAAKWQEDVDAFGKDVADGSDAALRLIERLRAAEKERTDFQSIATQKINNLERACDELRAKLAAAEKEREGLMRIYYAAKDDGFTVRLEQYFNQNNQLDSITLDRFMECCDDIHGAVTQYAALTASAAKGDGK